MNFNVEEFNVIIQRRVEMVQNFEQALTNISREIASIQTYIGTQENPSMYGLWEDLKNNIAKIQEKFVTKNQELLEELENYRQVTIRSNDSLSASIGKTKDQIDAIIGQLESL